MRSILCLSLAFGAEYFLEAGHLGETDQSAVSFYHILKADRSLRYDEKLGCMAFGNRSKGNFVRTITNAAILKRATIG